MNRGTAFGSEVVTLFDVILSEITAIGTDTAARMRYVNAFHLSLTLYQKFPLSRSTQ